jgi:hypothetical protein
MRFTHIPLAIAATLLAACQNGSAEQETLAPRVDLKTALPGVWELVSIQVRINSFEGQDTSFVFEISEDQWESIYKVRPARTIFDAQNRYRREYRAIGGDTLSVDRGMWNAFNDTLLLIEPDTSYQFLVNMLPGKGLAEWRRMVDWDGDGQADDEYLELQRLVGRSQQ